MRNARPYILIAISLLIGLVAVVAAMQWARNTNHVATTKVVVAARDLPPGTKVTAAMLQVAEFPAATVLKNAFADPAALEGRVVVQRIEPGEPILGGDLAKPGEQAGLAAILAPGQRAITVKVNDVSSVAGFTMPGSYVDLVVNTNDDNNRPLSKIVLERVLVLAVAQEMSPGDKGKTTTKEGTVTLAVTPEQAEQVDLARNIGHLAFALRNASDMSPVATSGARRHDLLHIASMGPTNGASGQAAPAPEPAKKVVVVRAKAEKAEAPKPKFEIIRGAKKSMEDVAYEANPT